jgi:hypothetical protein
MNDTHNGAMTGWDIGLSRDLYPVPMTDAHLGAQLHFEWSQLQQTLDFDHEDVFETLAKNFVHTDIETRSITGCPPMTLWKRWMHFTIGCMILMCWSI